MRSKKVNGVWYSLRKTEQGKYFIDWGTDSGIRKGQYYRSNGLNINKKIDEKYNIFDRLQQINQLLCKIENKLYKKIRDYDIVDKRVEKLSNYLLNKYVVKYL